MKELTSRQVEILCCIENYISKKKYAPTIREIADNMGITIKGAYDHVKTLAKKGVITYTKGVARSIILTSSD